MMYTYINTRSSNDLELDSSPNFGCFTHRLTKTSRTHFCQLLLLYWDRSQHGTGLHEQVGGNTWLVGVKRKPDALALCGVMVEVINITDYDL